MTTSFEALYDASASHTLGLGALHLRARNKRKATFFLQDGLIYAVRIENEEPPLLRRLHWSLDEHIDREEIQALAVNTHSSELRYMIEQRQAASLAVLRTVARDFFLATCEDVFSWGDVKQDWKRDESLPDKEGYRVPFLEVTQLRQILDRRAGDLEKFANYIGVRPEDVFDVIVVPGENNAEPENDAENVVLALRANSPTIGQIVGEGGYIGSATIAKAIFVYWNNSVVELYHNGQRLLRQGESVEEVAPQTDQYEEPQYAIDPEPQETTVSFDLPQRPQPIRPVSPLVPAVDSSTEEEYSIPLSVDGGGFDISSPTETTPETLDPFHITSDVEETGLEEVASLDLSGSDEDEEVTNEPDEPVLDSPVEAVSYDTEEPQEVTPEPVFTPAPVVESDDTGDIDELFTQLSSVLARVRSSIESEDAKRETLATQLVSLDEQIGEIAQRLDDLKKERETVSEQIERSRGRSDALKSKLQQLS